MSVFSGTNFPPILFMLTKQFANFRHSSNYELVDSEAQWREVQRKQGESRVQIHHATVIRDLGGNRRSGYVNSGMETESEHAYHHHKRKHRKHR
jgi:band 4.1-like protein 4A